MGNFVKILLKECILNPVKCVRRLRLDRHQAELWQKAQNSGGIICVHPSNVFGGFYIDIRSHVALQILNHGTYEEEITNELCRITLEHPGVIVNVGANIGLMSVFMAKKFARKTIAIEPNPEAFELLQKNVSLNGLNSSITCIQSCVGATTGNVSFSLIRGKPEYSSMESIVHPCVNKETRENITVPVQRLSQLVEERVALIFVDTEGAEELVFNGAEEIIQRDRPIIMCECTDVLLPKFGTSARNVVNMLINHGYKVYDVATGGALDGKVPDGFSSNIIALHNTRAEESN